MASSTKKSLESQEGSSWSLRPHVTTGYSIAAKLALSIQYPNTGTCHQFQQLLKLLVARYSVRNPPFLVMTGSFEPKGRLTQLQISTRLHCKVAAEAHLLISLINFPVCPLNFKCSLLHRYPYLAGVMKLCLNLSDPTMCKLPQPSCSTISLQDYCMILPSSTQNPCPNGHDKKH